MIPARPLTVLVAVVAAAHWWLLDAAPALVRPGVGSAADGEKAGTVGGATPAPAPWITRMLTAPAPVPAPAPKQAAAPAPRPAAAKPAPAPPADKPENAQENSTLAQADPGQAALDSIAKELFARRDAARGASAFGPAEPATEATPPTAPGPVAASTAVEPAPAASGAPQTPAALDPAKTSTATATEAVAAASAASAASAAASEPAAAPAPTNLAGAPLRIPQSMHLRYQVRGQVQGLGYNVNAQLIWTHDGERYDARQEISIFLLGSRVQTSRGRMTAQGLAPERFSDKARNEQAAHFDQSQATVSFSANTPSAQLQPGAQDRLSILIQLAALLGGAPERYPVGSMLAIQTIGARDADLWAFKVAGEETLQLASGAQRTVHLIRAPRRDYDVRVELWMAPALDYLPARVRLTQYNGDFVDLSLSALEKP